MAGRARKPRRTGRLFVLLRVRECHSGRDCLPAAGRLAQGGSTDRVGPLPLPAVDEALWTQLTLCREASAARVAEALYPADLTRQADFYSELCTKRSRGRAAAWTLEQGSTVVCTVGAYALCNGQAYMACGQTAQPLRGKGIGGGRGVLRGGRDGGRLIVEMANSLAAEGLRPVFLCAPERVRFYTRLGFAKQAEYARYVPEKS